MELNWTVRTLTSSEIEWEKHKIDRYNSRPGRLTGYDCPKCLNRGDSLVWSEEHQQAEMRLCECRAIREVIRRQKQSGLGRGMENMTFERFCAAEPWQQQALRLAREYARQPSGWLYFGGQVGCGKTHLCTAALLELAGQFPVQYMLWRDECARIKATLNEPEGIRRMEQLKTVKVLYIDDLFKTGGGSLPTPGDLNLAFELLNFRYNDEGLFTIISSENMLRELIGIDEAIGSRIAQRSRGHRAEILRLPERNWRLSHSL